MIRNAKVGSSILLRSTNLASSQVQRIPETPQPTRLAGFFVSRIIRFDPIASGAFQGMSGGIKHAPTKMPPRSVQVPQAAACSRIARAHRHSVRVSS
ncbi:hypothetical protein PSAB6_70243 [Paraburkholderia sabiae]|nr:hypothetical protein PSAB6_70243 [Paraburkholderia sabiae]